MDLTSYQCDGLPNFSVNIVGEKMQGMAMLLAILLNPVNVYERLWLGSLQYIDGTPSSFPVLLRVDILHRTGCLRR